MGLMFATAAKVGDPLAFYTVAATIIPVLYLAVVFQTRFFQRPSTQPYSQPVFSIVHLLGVFAFVGEAAAINVLAIRHPSEGSEQSASLAMMVLGIVLVAQPYFAIAKSMDRRFNETIARADVLGVPLSRRMKAMRATNMMLVWVGVALVCGVLIIVNVL